jgi:hypothetical protein
MKQLSKANGAAGANVARAYCRTHRGAFVYVPWGRGKGRAAQVLLFTSEFWKLVPRQYAAAAEWAHKRGGVWVS